MPQSRVRKYLIAWAPRLVGVLLLVILLTRLDIDQAYQTVCKADPYLIAISIVALIPLIFVKTIRWRGILRSQGVRFRFWPAFLAYFGSLFIGSLTPGRLGEFVKVVHVHRDCGVSPARAFSSVLGDRLFDFYALLTVGASALLVFTFKGVEILKLAVAALVLTLPLVLFVNNTTFDRFRQLGLKMGGLGRKLFAQGSWLLEMRQGLRQLTWVWGILAILLTGLAYVLFFGQCYLLAVALELPVDYVHVSHAVALGSLAALLPISVAGLGTREAAIVAYLSKVGASEGSALAFSMLIFVTFYIAGGVIGAVAWLAKPVPVDGLHRYESEIRG
jgi:uncharacterized protein (TIRG00374 family)